jgi:hypothetical protein
MKELENVREAVLAELEPVEIEIAEVKTRLSELELVQGRCEAILKTLNGGSKAKSTKSKAARKAGKPYARKADVMKVCINVLKISGPLAKARLESLVKKHLSEEDGFSLSGVGLRMSECLTSDQLNLKADDVVELVKTTPKPMATNQPHSSVQTA